MSRRPQSAVAQGLFSCISQVHFRIRPKESQHYLENHRIVQRGESLIYENIIALCKEKGISVARLEREAGLGNATVRNWEKGGPKVESLKKVADYFGVSLDELAKER